MQQLIYWLAQIACILAIVLFMVLYLILAERKIMGYISTRRTQ